MIRRRRRIRQGVSAAVLALAVASWVRPSAVVSAQPGDVFGELQRNAWYLPTSDGKAQLYVTALGAGPKVVVLHGGPGNDFHYLVSALRGLTDGHRFVLFDQRGSLLSPVTPDEVRQLSMTALVDDLDTLRVALGEERLVLLGHSFGTLLALAYYDRYPDRVAGLVLTAAVPPYTRTGKTFLDVIRNSRGRMGTLRSRPAVQAAVRDAGASGAHLTPEAQSIRRRIEENASFNLVHVERWRELHGGGVYYNVNVDDAIGSSLPETYDIRPSLTRHAVPVAVIQGDQDYVDPGAESWQTLVGSEPHVRVHVLESAGHYGWVDAPSAFREAVEEALRSIPGASQPASSRAR